MKGEDQMQYKSWDEYFYNICVTISKKSSCLSRQIGAILVRDHSIVSTGFNGPPRNTPHCGHDRYMSDKTLYNWIKGRSKLPPKDNVSPILFKDTCPRKVMGYKSGEGMEWCPAQHAEENAVSNAARLGVSVLGTTLYMNTVIPCQKCFGTLINAGISEIVVKETKVYDKHTQYIIDNSNITIRRFEL